METSPTWPGLFSMVLILLFCETQGIEEITLQPGARILQALADIRPIPMNAPERMFMMTTK